MFVLRGIAVSLTFFVLLYCVLSLMVVSGWRYLRLSRSFSAQRQANLLFWARVFPLLASAFVTLVLVVPSFVLREPRSIDEDMALPLVLGIGCLLLFALGAFRIGEPENIVISATAQRHRSATRRAGRRGRRGRWG